MGIRSRGRCRATVNLARDRHPIVTRPPRDARGLVERWPHPTDRRATLVALTDAGTQLAATMDVGYQGAAGELFDDFDADELRSFVVGSRRNRTQ